MSSIGFISKNESGYPLALQEISQPPARLYFRGNKSILESNFLKISIVGTRKATPVGEQIAYQLAKDLARQGVVVVSGLALGIDQAAHRGCLDAGGQTVAVLAVGLDKIYPSQHHNLAERIIQQNGA